MLVTISSFLGEPAYLISLLPFHPEVSQPGQVFAHRSCCANGGSHLLLVLTSSVNKSYRPQFVLPGM